MKKVININVGGANFTIDDDAYNKLKLYLDRFEATIADKNEAKEVMEDIELRIAEIFHETIKNNYQVVDIKLVEKIIQQLGQPEGSPSEPREYHRYNNKQIKRLYRNPDDKMLAGVCGGIAAYFAVDTSIIRIAALLLVVFGGLSIWVYIIIWIVVPNANTIVEKLEMRGEAVTAENIRNYSARYK